MDIIINYPAPKHRTIQMPQTRQLLYKAFETSFQICAIINFCVSGTPWCLYVGGAEILFWVIFIRRPLVENTLVQKVFDATVGICCFLILVDIFSGKGWSKLVVPIICFSLLIVLSLIFFIGFKKQRRNLMPLYWLAFGSLIAIICAIIGIVVMNWAIIVLGSVSMAFLIFSVSVYRKPILMELRKKFHF